MSATYKPKTQVNIHRTNQIVNNFCQQHINLTLDKNKKLTQITILLICRFKSIRQVSKPNFPKMYSKKPSNLRLHKNYLEPNKQPLKLKFYKFIFRDSKDNNNTLLKRYVLDVIVVLNLY